VTGGEIVPKRKPQAVASKAAVPNWPPRLSIPKGYSVKKIDAPYTSGGASVETLRPIMWTGEKQPRTK
jgi:hypothetical protein